MAELQISIDGPGAARLGILLAAVLDRCGCEVARTANDPPGELAAAALNPDCYLDPGLAVSIQTSETQMKDRQMKRPAKRRTAPVSSEPASGQVEDDEPASGRAGASPDDDERIF